MLEQSQQNIFFIELQCAECGAILRTTQSEHCWGIPQLINGPANLPKSFSRWANVPTGSLYIFSCWGKQILQHTKHYLGCRIWERSYELFCKCWLLKRGTAIPSVDPTKLEQAWLQTSRPPNSRLRFRPLGYHILFHSVKQRKHSNKIDHNFFKRSAPTEWRASSPPSCTTSATCSPRSWPSTWTPTGRTPRKPRTTETPATKERTIFKIRVQEFEAEDLF